MEELRKSGTKIPSKNLKTTSVPEEDDPGCSLFTCPRGQLQSIHPLAALPDLTVSKLSDSCLTEI